MGAQLMSRLQSRCYWMALIDIFLFFGTLLASVVVENVITERRPMLFEISDNGTVAVSFGEEKDELVAIWDYLHSSNYSSSIIYNIVYMSLIIIAVSYLIIEVWLCCVLIRGATEKSVAHCKKWFWWRVLIILATLAVSSTDLYQMQYTLTLLLLVPLNIYRIIELIMVLKMVGEMRDDDGNDKLRNFA